MLVAISLSIIVTVRYQALSEHKANILSYEIGIV